MSWELNTWLHLGQISWHCMLKVNKHCGGQKHSNHLSSGLCFVVWPRQNSIKTICHACRGNSQHFDCQWQRRTQSFFLKPSIISVGIGSSRTERLKESKRWKGSQMLRSFLCWTRPHKNFAASVVGWEAPGPPRTSWPSPQKHANLLRTLRPKVCLSTSKILCPCWGPRESHCSLAASRNIAREPLGVDKTTPMRRKVSEAREYHRPNVPPSATHSKSLGMPNPAKRDSPKHVSCKERSRRAAAVSTTGGKRSLWLVVPTNTPWFLKFKISPGKSECGRPRTALKRACRTRTTMTSLSEAQACSETGLCPPWCVTVSSTCWPEELALVLASASKPFKEISRATFSTVLTGRPHKPDTICPTVDDPARTP